MTNKNNNSSVSFEDRLRGALWGGFIGDAYCLGSHWIYSLDELEQKFPGGVKGFEEPTPGHYHYGKQSGDFTHYGDAALLMLSSVARCSRFDVRDFGSRLISLMVDKDYSGYRDHAIQGTVANYCDHCKSFPPELFDFQQGADDDQPATVTHLAPVVVAHLNNKDLLEIVATTTRVCQNNSRAIAYAQATALILSNLINGHTPESAVTLTSEAIPSPDQAWSEVHKRMELARASRKISIFDATMFFGQSCPLNSSFTAALHALLNCPDNFAGAIKSTANAGGDNSGRAAMIGSWLGAHLGIQSIPEDWRTRLLAHDQIEEDVERMVSTCCCL